MPFQRWLYGWRVRLRTLVDRDRADRELDDELRHHVALETESRRAQGVAPAEARRQALATLGGLESARNHVREARFGAALEHVLQDVRYVLRVLRRNPGFTATTVLTLTLAISATTATLSVVDAVLLQPPPFPEPERLVTLWETDPENGNQPAEVASANFLDWREQATSFEHVAALEPWSVDLTGADEPEVLYGWQVTEGFFEALGAGAARGRTFLPDEHRPGSGVVVMTDGLWRRRFGGDPAIVGRTLVLDDEPHTVVGVLAPSFELRLEAVESDRDVFLPKAIAEYETYIRNGGWWQVIARTRPDVTRAEAQAEMDAVAARLAADHPRTNAGVGARVIPLQTRQVAAVRPVLLLLWGAVVFVLLIACVNVANLMLARYARREQEFAVRSAVGGGPGRLLRQLLTESVVIAALGGLGGLVATAYALDLLVALMPADVPRLAQIAVNERRPRVHRRPRRPHRPGVRLRARRPDTPAGRQRPPHPGAPRRRHAGPAAAAAHAGGGRGRPRPRAPGRRGPPPAELRAAGQRRPRLHPAEHGGAAGVPLRRRRRRGHPQLLPRDPRRHSRPPRRRRRRRRVGVPARPRRPERRRAP